MRILLAEDERDLSDALSAVLTYHHYTVEAVYDGEDALYYAQTGQYDAIILDVMMPKKDGFQVVSELRKEGILTPVLLLTAKVQLEDKVTGLDSGADDYLTKPFEAQELLARLRSLLRRPATYAPDLMTFADLQLDRGAFTIQVGSAKESLNNKEFQLLELFLLNAGQVLSTDLIMDKVWGYDSQAEINVVWVNISSIRKKLQKLKSRVKIVSARGLGYQLEDSL